MMSHRGSRGYVVEPLVAELSAWTVDSAVYFFVCDRNGSNDVLHK